MKLTELKKIFKNKYAIRIAAGVLTVAMLGTGAGMYSVHAQSVKSVTKEKTEETLDISDEDTQEEALTKVLTKQAGQETSDAGKEETVYVVSDAGGKAGKVIVSDWLKNKDGSETLKDATDLSDVENVKGEESYTKSSGDEIIWQAKGQDIYYQGSTKKELPVDVSITYILDGKSMTPEEIAGKSGKVTIRMDYTNKEKVTVDLEGKKEEIYVPFTAVSGMILSDHFSNIQVTNGKLLSDGKNQMVVGVAMPGLSESLKVDSKDFDTDLEIPDYIEMTADVEDFSLDMTMTMIMSDALAELNMDESLDLTDLDKEMDELGDASTQLVAGTKELSDGTGTLAEKSGDLKSGVGTLKDGISTYTQGVSQVADGTSQLKEKSGSLIQGVNSLAAGINTVSDSVSGENGLITGAQAISSGVTRLDESLNTPVSDEEKAAIAENVKVQFAAGEGESKNAQIAAQTKNALEKGATDSVKDALNQSFYQVLYQAVLSQYAEAIENGLISQEEAQAAANQAAQAQVSQMSDSINALTGQIVGGIADQAGAAVAGSCSDAYAQGMVYGIEYAKGNVASQIEDGGLVSGAETMSKGVSKLYEEGITPIREGLNNLAASVPQLQAGIDQLSDGAGTLNDNSSALRNGADALQTGTNALIEGVGQLNSGAKKLDEGMVQFDEDGIKKLTETYNGDVKTLVDRIEAVIDAGKSYHTFTKLADGVDGSVKFIIRTEPVKSK